LPQEIEIFHIEFFFQMVEVNFNVWGNGSINPSGRITSEAPTYVVIHGYQSTGGNAGNNYKAADWMENIAQTI
jgi:hypothetical protein